MKTIEVDNKIFGYNIFPLHSGMVYAEIKYKMKEVDRYNLEYLVISKEFGSKSFWGTVTVTENDYKEATEWCKKQIEYIRQANE